MPATVRHGDQSPSMPPTYLAVGIILVMRLLLFDTHEANELLVVRNGRQVCLVLSSRPGLLRHAFIDGVYGLT